MGVEMKTGCWIYVTSEVSDVKNGAGNVLSDHSEIDNRVTVEMPNGDIWDLKPYEVSHRAVCPIKHD